MYTVELLDQEVDLIIRALGILASEYHTEQQLADKLSLKIALLKRTKDHPDDKQSG